MLEGVGSLEVLGQVPNRNVGDEHPVQPAYFMSFSEDPEGARAHGRGGHHLLELTAPDEFLLRVRDCLPPCSSNCRFLTVEWIRIEYGKTWLVDEDPGPAAGLHCQYHCKPVKFEDEKEWRLQIMFLHSFRIQNDTLKFRWGNGIGGLFKIRK